MNAEDYFRLTITMVVYAETEAAADKFMLEISDAAEEIHERHPKIGMLVTSGRGEAPIASDK